MSSTIKAAIQALKSRIADAYTAIVAKGGTLPATQDSANLPTAIASIPSGGGDIGWIDENSEDIKDYFYTISTVTKFISIDDAKIISLDNLAVATGSSITQPYLRTIRFRVAINMNSQSSFRFLPQLEFAQFDVLLQFTEDCFNTCVNLTHVICLKIARGRNNNMFRNCPKLIKIETGENFGMQTAIGKFTSNTFLRTWSPTEALLNNSTSLVESGEQFNSNLEKLLYNIRTYIAANINASSTGTIYFSAEVKAAILDSQVTSDAFTNKGWTIA